MRVEFVRWKDPARATREDYGDPGAGPPSVEDEALDSLLDAAARQPFRPAGAFLGGPAGMVPVAPHNAPGELWDLWVMHADGWLTPTACAAVADVPGVELLRPWSPYRAWFGVGRMFDAEAVQYAVRKAVAPLAPAAS